MNATASRRSRPARASTGSTEVAPSEQPARRGGSAMIDPDEIRERGAEVCRRLERAVAVVAPPGIGRWPRAWELVAPADAEFMAALSAWEADPTSEAARQAVRDTFSGVVGAWRLAAIEYRRHQGAER